MGLGRAGAVFILLLSGSFPLQAKPVTTVCGVLKAPTTWTREHSPYLVVNDIYIPPESRLSVEAGVEVRFAKPGPCPDTVLQLDWADSAYSGIKVDGALAILGTPSHPVVFEPETFRQGQVGWYGMRFSGSTNHTVEVRGAIFRGAHRALQAERSQFPVSRSVFAWNNTGIHLGYQGNLEITNCDFVHNRSAGVFVASADPRISSSLFAFNQVHGVWSDSRPTVGLRHNGFWSNADGHCFRCPFNVLALDRSNARGDSTDKFGNLVADPVFIGSDSHQKAMARDLELDTPLEKVKDKELAKVARNAASGQGEVRQPDVPPEDRRAWPYHLSRYSRLVDAGVPGRGFRDANGTPNDIGSQGGPDPGP